MGKWHAEIYLEINTRWNIWLWVDNLKLGNSYIRVNYLILYYGLIFSTNNKILKQNCKTLNPFNFFFFNSKEAVLDSQISTAFSVRKGNKI